MRIPKIIVRTLRLAVIAAAATGAAMLGVNSGDEESARALAPYSFGAENSWIRVQNVGNLDAEIELNYYNPNGQFAGRDACPSPDCDALFPGSGWTFFQRDNTALPNGFEGSAVIQTDQPIVAILAKDVFRGDKFAIAGDSLITGAGSHRVYLPYVAKRDGANADWNSRFVIQNLSDNVQACVQITYISNASDNEVAWEPYKLPATGNPQSPITGCPAGGMPLAPRGSIFRYPDTMPVSDRYTGSVRIDLIRNGTNQGAEKQFITVGADVWNTNVVSFGSYRGFDENDLGTEFVLPLVDRQVGPENSYSTRFNLVNKDPTKPATVTLTYDGYDLANGGVFVSKTNTFALKGSRLCFQEVDAFDCLADGDNLPFNFVGTARLSSTQPVAVVVHRGTFLNEGFTDYRGIRPQDASNRVLLPVLNKNYGPVEDVGAGWNSWFRVMVADGGLANVTVTYYGLDLPGGKQSYTVPITREFTVFQFDEWMLPDGFAGTAIISADKPITALANIYTDVFSGDPDMVYNGTPLR